MASPIVRTLRESLPDTVSIICGLLGLGIVLIFFDMIGGDINELFTADSGWTVLWVVVWGGCASIINRLRTSLGTALERRDESMESVR